MKKFLSLFCILFMMGVLPSFAFVREYFNTFYYNYLMTRKISQNDLENFEFLHKVSNDKIYWLDKSLNSECNGDKALIINLIDEEFYDLKESLDFEAQFVMNSPRTKKDERKIKKAHKKFMRRLKECFLR